jgi:predicted transcriptional regulator
MMDIVYATGSATAGDVRAKMADPPTYSAVRATLRILEQKGVLTHEDDGRRYIYRPTVKRSQARETAIEHLLSTFFNGSAAGAALALLERRESGMSREELDRMAAIIDRARKEGI